MNSQTLIVKTLSGLEEVLAGELKALGATDIQLLKRGVSCRGDQQLLYRANYELRTALRVLVFVHSFPAFREEQLYNGIREIDWSKFMRVNDTLAVDAVTQGEVFRHSQYASLLTKDAVVDQFRDKTNRRPSVNTSAPTLRIHVHIRGTHCDVLLDASDESLHKRGYRRDTVEAPLNEVLAAGMIQLSGWNGDTVFIDPMCGGGTLPIEATMLSTRTPAQLHREQFGFMRWPDFDEKLWKAVKKNALSEIRELPNAVYASDKDLRARNATAVNLMASGLEKEIQLQRMAFEKLEPPAESGVLMFNPPYDERMKVEEIESFYSSIGDRLKQHWKGWNTWIISSNRDALKQIGLKTSKRITLFNGALECSFQHFELY